MPMVPDKCQQPTNQHTTEFHVRSDAKAPLHHPPSTNSPSNSLPTPQRPHVVVALPTCQSKGDGPSEQTRRQVVILSSNSWSQSTRRSRSSGEVPPCQQANSTPGQAQKAESSAAPCARALTHREGEAERLIATCGSPTGPWPTMLHQWFLPQARMDDRPCP